MPSSRLAEQGIIGALARLLALEFIGEGCYGHQELVGRAVKGAFAILKNRQTRERRR